MDEFWFLRDTASGIACPIGGGPLALSQTSGATDVSPDLQSGEMFFNVAEARTIPAGVWTLNFWTDTGAGGDPANKIDVTVRRSRVVTCTSAQDLLATTTISLVKGAIEQHVLTFSPGEVIFGPPGPFTDEFIQVQFTSTGGNQTQFLRFNNNVGNFNSWLEHPGPASDIIPADLTATGVAVSQSSVIQSSALASTAIGATTLASNLILPSAYSSTAVASPLLQGGHVIGRELLTTGSSIMAGDSGQHTAVGFLATGQGVTSVQTSTIQNVELSSQGAGLTALQAGLTIVSAYTGVGLADILLQGGQVVEGELSAAGLSAVLAEALAFSGGEMASVASSQATFPNNRTVSVAYAAEAISTSTFVVQGMQDAAFNSTGSSIFSPLSGGMSLVEAAFTSSGASTVSPEAVLLAPADTSMQGVVNIFIQNAVIVGDIYYTIPKSLRISNIPYRKQCIGRGWCGRCTIWSYS